MKKLLSRVMLFSLAVLALAQKAAAGQLSLSDVNLKLADAHEVMGLSLDYAIVDYGLQQNWVITRFRLLMLLPLAALSLVSGSVCIYQKLKKRGFGTAELILLISLSGALLSLLLSERVLPKMSAFQVYGFWQSLSAVHTWLPTIVISGPAVLICLVSLDLAIKHVLKARREKILAARDPQPSAVPAATKSKHEIGTAGLILLISLSGVILLIFLSAWILWRMSAYQLYSFWQPLTAINPWLATIVLLEQAAILICLASLGLSIGQILKARREKIK